ncbi:serine/threonine protein kinase [Streptomyces lincolnensis]|uniref:Serine/threonine protein kinase n=1 Tax=Streptomyces lincolnensis TaxID=1915 RepID=A0A1B1MFX2_STRLN|nr:protein kinase [Streptomyces lincolnensis]ANS67407.1 serine/threonine protein kinase [Streptomyces lincolnensis]AXG56278.1 serine/threonine protein kinase [Streptomyces lincolnensis]QMV07265.1 protein kinase [Streptomyces lincolnensis]
MTDQWRSTPPSYTAAAGGAALRQTGATPLQPADPARIGPYLPLGRLGSGGMGRVFLARPADDRPGLAAVKVIRPEYAEDPQFRRRFEREAAVHGRVRTPHTPELLGSGFEGELLWMATQYLPGLNLADAVKECGPLEPAGVWRLVGELGQALAALAAAGVVHRDLKPSNVVLSPQGAHVIDFGISQAADSSAITGTGSRVGTPAFMSPEYLREGRCDTASDMFSLASSIVYAATGHAPFGDGTGVDVMHRVAFEEPRPQVMDELAAVHPALATLLSACLAKDPAARPTPHQLTEAATAAGHGPAPAWHEPLAARLHDRRQGSALLENASAQQTDHFRAALERTGAAGSGPGFGPPPPGAYAGGSTPAGPYGGSPTPAGPPAGTPTPPGQYGGMPTPVGPYAPVTPLTPLPADEGGGRRPRRKAYLAVAAGIAVVAVAAGAFLLTRPSPADTASGSPTASAHNTPDGAAASVLPTASPSKAAENKKEKKGTGGKETGEEKAKDDESPGADGGSSGAGGERVTPDPDPTATTGNGGGSAPSPTPTKTATKPATPPWISQCTYYSGTELTTRGDKGQRVVQVQCMLTQRGYSVGGSGVDGQFGADTVSAVKLFQGDKGLVVDGDVGAKTWAALRSST